MFKITLENNEILEVETGSIFAGLPLILLSLFIFIIPEFVYKIERSVQLIGVVSILLIVGILVTIFSRKYKLCFNKKENSLEICSQNLYKKFSEKYILSNITEVILNREINSGIPPLISYQIILGIKNGLPIYLDKSGSTTTRVYGVLNKPSEHNTAIPVAEHIASFLGIPFIKNF